MSDSLNSAHPSVVEHGRRRTRIRLDKRAADYDELVALYGEAEGGRRFFAIPPFETLEFEGNALTGVGVNNLFSGLVTAGLATPFTTANAQVAVGGGSTAATPADTDMSATAGATVNISSSTNAAPIVVTTASAHGLTVGQTVVVTGHTTNTNANGTWEVSAVGSSTTLTLLNSTGNGVGGATGTVAPINKYRQGCSSVTANPAVGGSITGVTNSTNPTITTSSAHGLAVNQIVNISGIVGATGANGTWYVATTPTSTTFTITAAAPGAYTSGGTVNLLGGAQFVATIGANNANFAWNEIATSTGGAATNKQASPPPVLLNRAVASLGTKTSAASWTITETLSIS
jgi:hypothetical protein